MPPIANSADASAGEAGSEAAGRLRSMRSD
jgi:hypothetical protein